jgi:CheY-like chemotaxis protein
MPRVLVVDDQAHVRAAVGIALRAIGFQVVGVADGAAALNEFHESGFDLAVIDIYMPGFDGVKLIKAMRQRVPDFPVIAMSGVFLAKSQRTTLDYLPDLPGLTMITCLKKPFRPHDLLSAVQIALGDSMSGLSSIVPGITPCQAS